MKIRRDSLDDLFSEFIRKRAMILVGGCERIEAEHEVNITSWRQLHCAHFHTRAKKSVRFDEDNAAGLCFGCHQYLDSHPMEKIEWFQKRLGDMFDLLLARARTPQKIDREAIRLYLKAKIEELDGVLYM